MARRALLLLLLFVTVAAAAVHTSAVGGEDDVEQLGLEGLLDGGAGTRRWLEDLGNATATDDYTNTTTGFISYDALYPDTVPCSLPGASYYNCRPGADANPYSRGCSAITQCRD